MKTFPLLLVSLTALFVASELQSAEQKPSVAAPDTTLEGYVPVLLPDNIAPTAGTVNDPNKKVVVQGQPRMAEGHPCTLWDKEDIARYRELLKTDPELQKMVSFWKGKMDKRITQPLDVPSCHKGPDGKWIWPQNFPADEAPHQNQSKNCAENCGTMATLGILYQFTGEQKYGEYCRKMFLAYAASYPYWARNPKATWRSCADGRVSFQFLNDGFDLGHWAWAYDLISTLPTLTKEDRVKIHDNFFIPMIAQFFVNGKIGADYLSTPDNRSCICAAAVLMAGYATDDQEMVNFAMNGHVASKLQPVFTEGLGEDARKELGIRPGKTPDAPGGLMNVHFSPNCIHNDGLWTEGSPGYTLGIAGSGLFDDAEVLWRHGIDMYRYRNGVLKRLIDSALLVAYPGEPALPMPVIGDSGAFELLDKRNWSNGETAVPFNLGYQRYGNPQYLPIIENATAHISLTIHAGGPLIKANLPDSKAVPASKRTVPLQNANFYESGLGFLRIAEEGRVNSLLMLFGDSWQGHDHPCKLGIDLYAFHSILMPLCGDVFPYSDPLDPNWYDTSLANCVMVVDMMSQICAANHFTKEGVHKLAPKAPYPTVPQLVYAPAATMGMQRAYSNTECPGSTMDRSLFLTSRYMADLYGGFSSNEHTFDLAWHFLGTVDTALSLSPMSFPEPVPVGYNSLSNIRHAITNQPWSATVTFQGKQLPFWTAADGKKQTDVIFANGHYNEHKDTPPTILVRRKDTNTVFGTVMDLSGDASGYIKGAIQEGGLKEGYGLLQVQTTKGIDQCFVSYRPGAYKTSTSLETDAQQAFVVMDGKNVQALYLAGGKTLTVPGGSIARSVPGLAYVEKLANGKYVVGNPSPSKATVTVNLPGLGGQKSFDLDAGEQWTNGDKSDGKLTQAGSPR